MNTLNGPRGVKGYVGVNVEDFVWRVLFGLFCRWVGSVGCVGVDWLFV